VLHALPALSAAIAARLITWVKDASQYCVIGPIATQAVMIMAVDVVLDVVAAAAGNSSSVTAHS
jgi:hypothetical protein